MKTTYKAGMIIFAVLTALGIMSDCFLLFRDFSGSIYDVIKMTDIVVLLLIVVYAAVGYKKPHGNLLKFLMLIFAICIMPKVYSDASRGLIFLFIMHLLSIICIVYIAARLNRIEQNKYLMLITLILMLVSRIALAFSFESSFDIMYCIGSSTTIIIWADLCFAYFLRYSQHKEAGLSDRVH